MKLLQKKLSIALFAVLACICMASCSGSESGGGSVTPPANTFYSFATYNGSAEGKSSFDVQRDGNSPVATITFAREFTKDQLAAGTRVYIAYTTLSDQQYVSGPGQLYSITKVDGGKPVEATDANAVRLSSPIKLAEMKRTGDYLNVVFQVSMLNTLMRVQLTEKENTKEPEYPMLGLYVLSDSELGQYRYARASFNVKSVLDREDVEGFKVEYYGDRGIDTLTFLKNSGPGTITPIE